MQNSPGHKDHSLIRRITKNFSLSAGGSLALIVIGLFRTAILTKSISLADYGRVLIVINLFTFLAAFLSLRVNDIIYRFYPQFEETGDGGALRGLILLSFTTSLLIGLIVSLGTFILAPWIAERFYGDPELSVLFRIYSVVGFMASFSGLYTSILRLKDRFPTIIFPQVLGGFFSLACLAFYFLYFKAYRLEWIIAIFMIGGLIQSVPPLLSSLQVFRPHLSGRERCAPYLSFHRYRTAVLTTLFHTNLAGYLKIVFSPGDVFLLGIFASPTHVALYGLAQQVIKPFKILQNNIQTAISPEVVSLWAKKQIGTLKALSRKYVGGALIIGGICLVFLFFLARPIILLIAREEYLQSLPLFYALATAAWLSLSFTIFYPVGLVLDMLKWFNLANLLNIAVLLAVILSGELTALRMAYFQLAATLIRRVAANLLVADRLRRQK